MSSWRIQSGRILIVLAMAGWTSAACHAQAPPAGRVAESSTGSTLPQAAPVPKSVLDIAGEEGLRLDPAVPSPQSVLGFEIGTRPIRFLELEQYLRRLAAACQRVELRTHGTTHEGRALYHLVVSSRANIQRLDDIRSGLAKLADPRTTNDDEAATLVDTSPAVAWMSYTVHGDELSGTDAAIVLAYRLAAGQDQATRAVLNSVVVCIDPLQNPDGRERFLSMMQQLGGRVPSGDTQSAEHSALWPWGRSNHYLFDMNRDWNMTVHPESRGRVAAIAAWHPQLLVDAHEMGSTDTYLFSPPREPLNLHISASVLKWTDRYSADQATAFDRHGWSYYRGEWNEGWAIGFSDIWAKHHGAVGMLYEQAGSEGSSVRLPTDQERFYREDLAHQYVSSMANLTTLADNRGEILADFHAAKKQALADARSEGQRDLFLFVPGPNRTRAAEFLGVLQRQNIETFVLSDGTATLGDVVDHWGTVYAEKTFPAGTVAVSMKQPLSPLARTMLEFDPRPSDEFLKIERRELELRGRSKFYDLTGWCASMCYDLDAYWARGEDLPPPSQRRPATAEDILAGIATAPPAGGDVRAAGQDQPPYGFLIDGADDAGIRLVGRLLQDQWKIRVGRKPFTASGRSFPPGTFLIRMHENEQPLAQLTDRLAELPGDQWMAVQTARSKEGPDLGGTRFPLLTEPRIALIFESPFSSLSSGAIWHLLDARLGLRMSRLSGTRLGYYDLRKYNVIVLPNSWGGSVSRVLNDATRQRLTQWVKEGGTLVAIGGTAAALSKEDGLGRVRLRRDVLDKLDIYAEDARRQRSAVEPEFDINQVWDFKKDAGPPATQPAESGKKKKDAKALERWDAWARRFMPRGTILRIDLHPEHWLAHGLGTRAPVMYGSRSVLMATSPVQTIARLAQPESLRLSGLLWPEARERLGDGAYMTRERMGRGQVILFATDPVFRGYMEGTTRLFLNAVILGPGVGASTPTPW